MKLLDKVTEILACSLSFDRYDTFKKWTVKYVNTLPDSSFAVIEPAYLKGESSDKRCRHLPYRNENGKIDMPHLRNALARCNQITPFTDSIKAEELRKQAMATLMKAKHEAGMM